MQICKNEYCSSVRRYNKFLSELKYYSLLMYILCSVHPSWMGDFPPQVIGNMVIVTY